MNTGRTARRRALEVFGAVALLPLTGAMAQTPLPMATRTIPRSGETLPMVGVGTYQAFDVGAGAAERAELAEVLRRLVLHAGSVIDSSPMYGRAEAVAGDLARDLGLTGSLFLATKVWTRGAPAGVAQMQDSLRLLHTRRIDLMQVHNLVDWRTHLQTMAAWKTEGRLRYLGVTHYHAGAYGELMSVLKTGAFDFVQFNYSLAEREAEERLLPLCADLGVAVIVNRPYAQGDLFARVKGKPVPDWAKSFDCSSWAQFFLKWILGHPAVTCVIPGTRRVAHLEDNVAAARGRLPDRATRQKMLAHLQGM